MRRVHRGIAVRENGGVLALCNKGRAINLHRASWTNRNEAVTCPNCKRLLKEKAAT